MSKGLPKRKPILTLSGESLGLLTEAHALRRYTDALELRQRDLVGEE